MATSAFGLAVANAQTQRGQIAGTARAEPAAAKRVLVFTKAASWEQIIVHRDGDQLSLLEKALDKLGRENGFELTITKDGSIFTAANIARFDAFLFFTSGDLTFQDRNGRGDNYPLMTLEGKRAFLDAVRDGKGFIGCNTANYTFPDAVSPGEKNDAATAWRYTKMIGAGYMGHNAVQRGHFSYLDRKFPGMEDVPADYQPIDQWYAFNRLMPDIHVIMALDSPKLTGNLYERSAYPIAWARMEGRGRVFYTTMGHTAEIWSDPVFLRMLLGGIRWATGLANADITADMAQVTPRANEIPERASEYIATHPPLPNPRFPGFAVHYPQLRNNPRQSVPSRPPKRVLFFTKSAGYEHPIVYRNGAFPSWLEREMLEFGQQSDLDFAFSKDGTIFTPENIAPYDAFVFYTSGDPIHQTRNGLGDNYKLMTPEGKQVLLEAIRRGKGFVGIHSAIDTFCPAPSAPADPYGVMLGATSAGHGGRSGRLVPVDRAFPGMEQVAAAVAAPEEWYAVQNVRPDLHVVLSLDGESPLAWARTEGKGRVYYTSLGHGEQTWASPVFRQMLLGALRWATGEADADIRPNFAK